jgi:RNA polymerase sigma factor (sigma-70 family)
MDDQVPPPTSTRAQRKRGRKRRRLSASTAKYVAGVYERTLKPLTGYCVRVTGNSADGEDLTHDCYVSFMTRVQNKGQVQEETEVAFLKKVAVNENRRTWRRNKVRATESLNLEDGGSELARKQAQQSLNDFKAAEREISRLEELKELWPTIRRRLSEAEYTAILGRYGYGLTYEAIGKELGQTPDEVKYLVIKTMSKIRYWGRKFAKRNCP